jgi:uncharacterized protein (TIGR03435 family)
LFLFFLAAALPAAPQQNRVFDVVSIKLSKPGAPIQEQRIIIFPPGRMEAKNITLSEILLAFSGFTGIVRGGPKWAESERYDISAKADGEIKPAERDAMVIALLEDRFKVAVHHEKKEESGLALTTGKQPPDLKPAKEGETTLISPGERGQINFRSISMPKLANYVRDMLDVQVVDQTGMAGSYNFSIETAGDPAEAFRDRVRSAVEALGFKLAPLKITRDVTIIDHVERPTEN